MTLLQTLILAITQGITELFPISSVAHAVLTPYLLTPSVFGANESFLSDLFLPIVVVLHVGTAVALLAYFWRDWAGFAMSVVGPQGTTGRRELLRIVIGTVPAVLIGLALKHPLERLFASVPSAAAFLIVNGFLLYFGEKMRGRGSGRIENLGYFDALFIGLAQSLALVPGFSRSGASMLGGFWAGLSHGESARFSMLLATPIIAGAAVLEVPKLLHQASPDVVRMALIGGVVAGVTALISVWILMRWFNRREVDAMLPFSIYCWVVGAGFLALWGVRHA